jgi:type 1 glutamine amidotransferase
VARQVARQVDRRVAMVGAVLLFLVLVLSACVVPPPDGAANGKWVLLFTRAQGFVHDSINPAVQALTIQLHARGYGVVAGADLGLITPERLTLYQAVVFVSTTGDVLDPPQQDALTAWVNGGGGWVGIHGAIDAEYDWPFYGQLAGARFQDHPAIQPAVVRVADASYPAESGLPAAWARVDEWYNFQANPRTAGVHVLATVDESTYSGGEMGGDHPIEWCSRIGAGQTYVTAMGHTIDSWADPTFVNHVVNGIDAVSTPGSCPG